MIKTTLIRSQALNNHLGHRTGKFNWTECRYVFGILVRSIQVKNIDYSEAEAIFGNGYKYGDKRDHEWWQVIVFNKK